MPKCPDCRNTFVQEFRCVTCGAQKLYDATLQQAETRAEKTMAENEHLRGELDHLQSLCSTAYSSLARRPVAFGDEVVGLLATAAHVAAKKEFELIQEVDHLRTLCKRARRMITTRGACPDPSLVDDLEKASPKQPKESCPLHGDDLRISCFYCQAVASEKERE